VSQKAEESAMIVILIIFLAVMVCLLITLFVTSKDNYKPLLPVQISQK
jgi:uncharacterized protein involved in outer membrane biogenesis